METEYAPETRKKLADYLEAGSLLVQYRGLSWCRCCRANNGSRELYDGDWAWPEGLVHYLREHSVGLPPDFVRRATLTVPPRPTGDPQKRRAELDHSDWIEWARPFRTPAMTKMLDEAREASLTTYETTLDAHAAELATKQGVVENACAWAGCERHALAGKAICARHAAANDRPWLLSEAEHIELKKLVDRLSALKSRT